MDEKTNPSHDPSKPEMGVMGGTLVGIPLGLLQLSLHANTAGQVDLAMLGVNFALGSAIYDADRLEGPWWAPERLPTRLSALVAAAYYATDEQTLVLAPTVIALHLGYQQCKPRLAVAKPFVVAALWTVAVYAVPLMRAHVGFDGDAALPASLFLSLAALSQAADVRDVDEDRATGVRTPAVRMDVPEAGHYALVLALAAAWLHAESGQPFVPFDVFCVATVAGSLSGRTTPALATATLYLLLYCYTNDVELLTGALRSTETSHGLAIAWSLSSIDWAFGLPEPLRGWAVETVLRLVEMGDAMGRALLELFDRAVMRRLAG